MVLSTYVYVFLKVDGYNIPRTWPSFDCALALSLSAAHYVYISTSA